MIAAPQRIDIASGVVLWRAWFDRTQQMQLARDVLGLAARAPFYRPRMPRSGKPFSVEQTNLGALGWYSDEDGYRYVRVHPITGEPWPAIPKILERVWQETTGCAALPECCLVNRYLAGARMGQHQDRDEEALDAPVLSVSLGDSARFRIGGTTRKAPANTFLLDSGDVVIFGAEARLAFHGIDKVMEDTSDIVPGGGRLNLTLRRVTELPKIKDARSGG